LWVSFAFNFVQRELPIWLWIVVCKYTVHERCAQRAPASCVTTYVKSKKTSPVSARTFLDVLFSFISFFFIIRRWTTIGWRATVPANATDVKSQSKRTTASLVCTAVGAKSRYVSLSWAEYPQLFPIFQLHNKCASQVKPECDFGEFREHILSPTAVCPAVLVGPRLFCTHWCYLLLFLLLGATKKRQKRHDMVGILLRQSVGHQRFAFLAGPHAFASHLHTITCARCLRAFWRCCTIECFCLNALFVRCVVWPLTLVWSLTPDFGFRLDQCLLVGESSLSIACIA
jgi:hypothetical protein